MKLQKIVEKISLDPKKPTLFQLLVNAKGIPLSSSFKLGKLEKKFVEETDQYNKVRNEKITELGEEVFLDDEGKEVTDEKKKKNIKPTFRVKEENTEKFFEEANKLLDQDVDITLPNIKIEDLGEPILEMINPNFDAKKKEDKEKNPKTIKIDLTPKLTATLDWLLE